MQRDGREMKCGRHAACVFHGLLIDTSLSHVTYCGGIVSSSFSVFGYDLLERGLTVTVVVSGDMNNDVRIFE